MTPAGWTAGEPMTAQQIENYRSVLFTMLGPYALLMSAEQIEAHRNMMQQRINQYEATYNPHA